MQVVRARQAAVVLLVVAATAAGLALLVSELNQRERDRHAILALVDEIATKLRTRDMDAWMLVERDYQPGERHLLVEPAHEQLRFDLSRLARLDDLRLVVVDVDLGSDSATADYRVDATAAPARPPVWGIRPTEEPVPTAGQFRFRREGGEWTLTGHAFVTPPSGSTGTSSSPVRPGHRHGRVRMALAIRLAAIAGLALLGSGVLLLQPKLAVVVSKRRHRMQMDGRG